MERGTQMWLIGGFIAVVVLAVGAAAYFSNGAAINSSGFVATTVPPITSADHVQGDANSKVTVIEYGDFECPACGEWEPLVEQLEQQYDNRVEFVFRNFPLYQIHPFAKIGAQAAEAAALQGKYWQMHDLLYKNQAEWTADTTLQPADVVSKFFNGYAQSLGLNVSQFDTDINSSAVIARVQRDIDSGDAAQINHTPTFFVDLKQIQNPTGIAQFQQIIDQTLASSSATQASSTATK
ncbi:MAG TPA: thioredoxin domain-containing protein [Candidatus Paceibacterota bacterium]|jgi:protein-disulfide isomerase|nr:thioredoxin domain-containing protein [Candidatus Paceibacterota bacterium]